MQEPSKNIQDHISDEALADAARAGDTDALDCLMQRYKNLVRAKAKHYYLADGDSEDLIQEGMIGLYKAVLDYNSAKGASFAAFAPICIVRQIQTAIKASSRKKHIPLNTSFSLDNDLPKSGSPEGEAFINKLPDHVINDPEALFIGQEAVSDLDAFIRRTLSDLEFTVLLHRLNGKTLGQIATTLNKDKKSIDNTLQRVRKKLGTRHMASL